MVCEVLGLGHFGCQGFDLINCPYFFFLSFFTSLSKPPLLSFTRRRKNPPTIEKPTHMVHRILAFWPNTQSGKRIRDKSCFCSQINTSERRPGLPASWETERWCHSLPQNGATGYHGNQVTRLWTCQGGRGIPRYYFLKGYFTFFFYFFFGHFIV